MAESGELELSVERYSHIASRVWEFAEAILNG
jgi:hypothetical protein